MSILRPMSWFLTESGRNFSYFVITTTGISLASLKFLPHTLLLNKYRDFVHYYSNGQPVPLSEEMKKRFDKCMDIVKISERHRKMVTPFRVFGFDLFHAGSCKSRFGAIVGIPVHFSYKSVEDLTKDNIQVNGKSVKWNTNAGRELADAFILPENVQQFAMCREILAVDNSKVFIEATYPFLCVFMAYTMSNNINKKLELYTRPRNMRLCLYIITGLFSTGLYFFLKDYTEVYYETQVDKQLCTLGNDFIRSGIEFYDKLLKRNRALRELMGSEGEAKYSAKGNENFFLRQPRIALVHRKAYFESVLNDNNSKESADNSFTETS